MTTISALPAFASFKQPDNIDDNEWAARCELAACYRVFDYLGWTELIYNHITLRLSDANPPAFLINPFGLHYSEVTPLNLVKVDGAGNILGDSRYPINPAGFTVHAALHNGLPGAHCVMHTHTTAGVAVACSAAGLRSDNFYSAQLQARVAYHDFEGVTVNAEEGPRLIRSIDGKKAVILRNHGLLSWGGSLPEAFTYLWTLNRACEIQLATSMMGPSLAISPDITQKCARDALQFDPAFGAGRDVFDALVRVAFRAKG
ncbi:class II aldolase [Pandoraea captiosa]|jgi:ribulose-5-phosphate 4-epimerase/fuculose-1-phosphate aldolase|uniref:Class II aldolase n=1 Tax=Pandoraea captiosa TaxID=2508302 RepID=A0A5E5AMU7_9BURK|nr:class II aldolase/adducin family protein [Pandoraea captiosa]VVE74386.1 class II aldolase [Pandoraea captiosa]